VLANISARNPEPREWLARGRRAGKGANRRLDAGPRLIIEVGAPPKAPPPPPPAAVEAAPPS